LEAFGGIGYNLGPSIRSLDSNIEFRTAFVWGFVEYRGRSPCGHANRRCYSDFAFVPFIAIDLIGTALDLIEQFGGISPSGVLAQSKARITLPRVPRRRRETQGRLSCCWVMGGWKSLIRLLEQSDGIEVGRLADQICCSGIWVSCATADRLPRPLWIAGILIASPGPRVRDWYGSAPISHSCPC
jgi:hypothetical protein